MRLAVPTWLAVAILATSALILITAPTGGLAKRRKASATTTQKPTLNDNFDVNDNSEGSPNSKSNKDADDDDNTDDYLDENDDYEEKPVRSHHHHVHVHPKSSRTTRKPRPCDKAAGKSRNDFDDAIEGVEKATSIFTTASPDGSASSSTTSVPDSSSTTTAEPDSSSRSDNLEDDDNGSSSKLDGDSRSADMDDSPTTTTSAPSTTAGPDGGGSGDSRASAPEDDEDQDSSDDYSDEGEYRTTLRPGCPNGNQTKPGDGEAGSPLVNATIVVSTTIAPTPATNSSAKQITIKPLTKTTSP